MKRKFLLCLFLLPLTLRAREFSPRSIVDHGLARTQQLVLTFDDGPVGSLQTGTTKEVLDVLKAFSDYGFKAPSTFFVLGSKVKGRESLLRRMNDEGHIVANHTWSHPSLTRTIFDSAGPLINELLSTHDIIGPYLPNVTELTKRWYFRAPGGAWKGTRAGTLNAHSTLKNYIGPIYWNIGGELRFDSSGIPFQAADWACWSQGVTPLNCARGYLRETERHKGGVVLFHDINPKTAEMLKYLLVAWTGFNPFKDEIYETLLKEYQPLQYRFVSLDDVDALDIFNHRE